MAIYAHSVPGKDPSTWEILPKHHSRVANCAASAGRKFGAEELARVLGELHDFGKVDPAFQARLFGSKKTFDHAAPGALLARRRFGTKLGEIIALAVAGHHTGLMDSRRGGDLDPIVTPLDERLADKGSRLVEQIRTAEEEELQIPNLPSLPNLQPRAKRNPKDDDTTGFSIAFFVRMLFSALVDADFLATEAFYDEAERRSRDRGSSITLADLKAALDRHLDRVSADAKSRHPGIVTEARADVLAAVRAGAAVPPGIFTLAVPTGGGKTLASLAFALDHAAANDAMPNGRKRSRVITVIPFTSIVEQTAEVYRTALGEELGSAVLEHHGSFDDTAFEPEMRDKLRLDQQNWDAPLVVTTAVQFFESLFASRTSRCRKLHNIVGSIVILDEVQTLPLGMLRPTVLALDELVRNYGCTIVLCTATQPAILETDDPEKSFNGGLRNVTPLIADTERLFERLKRVEVQPSGTVTDEELAQRIAAKPQSQSLTIVNTRKHARALFDRIAKKPGARHLSTMMCAAHRSAVLAEIKADLKAERPVRLVSTSLIEAGVDISLPLVMRAAAGLDQIAQAAGRCNREGEIEGRLGEVLVFEPEENHPEMAQRWAAASTVLRAIERGEIAGGMLGPPAIEAYFRELFWTKGSDALDEEQILELLRSCCARRDRWAFPMETVARKFRLIDETMVPILIPWNGEARELIAALPHVDKVGGIARKLQRYLVNIPPRDRGRLIDARAARVIEPQRFGDQFVELIHEDLYRPAAGLDVTNPAFIESGRLIV